MSTIRHTPGPWEIDEPHQVWAESIGEYVAITAQIEDHETVPQDQAEANAKLIAAAPDLLEALKLIVLADRWCPTGSKAEVLARAAIAKAEGKHQRQADA
ncbi:MAG: hypothetical protein ACK5NY_03395 [Burkholderiaceae bacterium]